jgi:hypothetical protein
MTRRWCLLVPVGAEPRLAAQRGIPSRLDLGVQSKATMSVRSFGMQVDGGLGSVRRFPHTRNPMRPAAVEIASI